MTRQLQAQQKAKEAAQKAAEQAESELRETTLAAQAERAARAAAEAEDRTLNGKLSDARRRSEALEEELQVRQRFASGDGAGTSHARRGHCDNSCA